MNRKGFLVLMAVLMFMGGIAAVSAQDLIILRDGNVLEAKVTEISPSEVKYKRPDHMDGPTIVVPAVNVLSIRYANGKVDIIAAASAPVAAAPVGAAPAPAGGALAGTLPGGITGLSLLQEVLNQLPAIPVAGKNLKFLFAGETWRAQVNGADTLDGTLTFQSVEDGAIITLKPVNAYLRGRKIPAPAGDIVLEYKAGPPMSLRSLSKKEQESVAAGMPSAGAPSTGASFAGVSSAGAIVLSNDDWKPNQGSGCRVQAEVSREIIDGEEKDVMTLNARIGQGGWAQTVTFNDAIAEQLRNASGIRFKAMGLGGGNKWQMIVGMSEALVDGGTHRVDFTTKKGKVVEIDLPFSRFKQPGWGKRVKFNRDSIVMLAIEKNAVNGAGSATVKIFDIEVY